MGAPGGETKTVGTAPSSLRVDRFAPWVFERGSRVGRYILVDPAGHGGMGEVFAALDPELGRKVALKLVRVDHAADDPEAEQRLLREAQALAKLSHPNVVAVYDVGTHGDRVYLAMEFAPGQTLKAWADERRRSWNEILDVLLDAGAGLAAAHGVGMVHRDFKPANVMLTAETGGSLRVRVLDFGLARAVGEVESWPTASPVDAETSGSGRISDALTRTGTVLGTPAYMAPEQFQGRDLDERSDQFSFCVVAYRLLYGVAPFDGQGVDELSDAVGRGRLRPAPAGRRVPVGLRAALERGLRPNPDDRWPSMHALLRRLEGVRRTRRRIRAAAVVAVLVGGGGAATYAALDQRPCEGVGDDIAHAWSDAKRDAVHAAFERTATSYGEDSWTAVKGALDRYANSYAQERYEACAATRVRSEQSARLMDLRMSCLDGRRAEMRALVDVLAAADTDVVRESVQAVSQLGGFDRCRDVEALTATVDPPPPEVADEVAALEEDAARLLALTRAGQHRDVVAIRDDLLERARATGYPPILAAIALLSGLASERLSDAATALQLYEEALTAAARGGDRVLEGRALTGMAGVLGLLEHEPAQAARLAEHAASVFEGAGAALHDRKAAELSLANAYFSDDDFVAAIPRYEALLESIDGVEGVDRARQAAMSNLAGAYVGLGEVAKAVEVFERLTSMVQERLGPHHPEVGKLSNNLAILHVRREAYGDAVRAVERALSIYKDALGERNFEVARALHNLGVIERGRGNHEASRAAYAEALAIKAETVGRHHRSYGLSANNLAEAYLALGRPQEALPIAMEADAVLATDGEGGSPHVMATASTLSDCYLALGRYDEGIAAAQRALEAAEAAKSNIPPWDRATMDFTRGRLLWGAGRRAEGHAVVVAARDALAGAQGVGPVTLGEVEAWLAEHGGAP